LPAAPTIASAAAPAMACHFPGRRSRGAASPVDLAELLDDERAHHAEGFVAGFGADGLVRAGRARGELKRGRLARLNERRRQVQSVYVPVVGDGALVADDQADPLAAAHADFLRLEGEVVQHHFDLTSRGRGRRGRAGRGRSGGRGRAFVAAPAASASRQQQRQHQNAHEGENAPPCKHYEKPLSDKLYAVTPHVAEGPGTHNADRPKSIVHFTGGHSSRQGTNVPGPVSEVSIVE